MDSIDRPAPRMALMTVEMPDANPSLARAAVLLDVAVSALDRSFGVVPIGGGAYAVRVRSDALAPGAASETEGYRGPWADPPIAV
jgi:hypothetical protein